MLGVRALSSAIFGLSPMHTCSVAMKLLKVRGLCPGTLLGRLLSFLLENLAPSATHTNFGADVNSTALFSLSSYFLISLFVGSAFVACFVSAVLSSLSSSFAFLSGSLSRT